MSGILTGYLLFAGGVLLFVWQHTATKTASLEVRLAAARGTRTSTTARTRNAVDRDLPPTLANWLGHTRRDLILAGEGKTLRRLLLDKLLAAVAVALIPLVPYTALTHRAPSPFLALILAAAGFWVPDLALRSAVRQRRERVFTELPDALAMMALSLGAGQSLRRALELAARDCRGPLGVDIATALTRARRDTTLDERHALVQVASEGGEPNFARFTQLLATKESPYLDFLRSNAAQARSEQNRLLEQAADRAYLKMHAPLAPLLTTLILVVAYGFLHLLQSSI